MPHQSRRFAADHSTQHLRPLCSILPEHPIMMSTTDFAAETEECPICQQSLWGDLEDPRICIGITGSGPPAVVYMV